MRAIPTSWSILKLGEIAKKITKGTTPTTNGFSFTAKGINFIKIENLVDGNISLSTIEDFISEEAHYSQQRSALRNGDVLFSIAGTIGTTAIVEDRHLPANTNQAIAIISQFDSVLFPRFLQFQLQSFAAVSITSRARGGAMNNVSLADLKDLDVVVAPQNEQRRIVTKIEELFSELDKGVESLLTAREQLKAYRQSVLKHAFEGNLTADWRAKNPDKLEPVEQHIARLKEARDAWQTREIDRWQVAENSWEPGGGEGQRPAKPSKPVDVPTALEELPKGLPLLPNGWCWVPLDLVALAIDPQPSHRTPPEVKGGIPYVGVGDIDKVTGEFNFEAARKVSPDVLEEHKERYELADGDFILGKIGTIGKPFKIPSQRFYTLSANIVLVRPIADIVEPSFIFSLSSSPIVEMQFEAGSNATTQAAFGIKKVRLLMLPICSGEEQRIVCSILSRTFEAIERAEREIDDAVARVNLLRQSVLSAAFSGRLVAQDPNDGPASIVLARIRTEKQEVGDKSKKMKTNTKEEAS